MTDVLGNQSTISDIPGLYSGYAPSTQISGLSSGLLWGHYSYEELQALSEAAGFYADAYNYAKQLANATISSITGSSSPNVATTPTGQVVQLDFSTPEQTAAAKQVIETGFPMSSPNFAKAVDIAASSPNIVRLPDFPISGPTAAPFGDQPLTTSVIADNNPLSQTVSPPTPTPTTKTTSEGVFNVSFLSDIGNFLGEAYSFLQNPFGLGTAPGTQVAQQSGMLTSVAPIVKQALPVAAAAAGGALTDYFLSPGSGSAASGILKTARAHVPGATKKKIVAAARHCGIDNAASMFGLTSSEVCQLVISPTRRRRGISAADVRRTKSTIRKIEGIRKSLKSAGICRR